MDIVCPAWYSGADKICEALPVLALDGARAVEIGLSWPSFFDCHHPDQVDKLILALERVPLRVHSIHAPFGPHVDFSSFDDKVHESGVDAQIEAIEIARLLGAGYVIVHASDGQITADRRKRLDRARGVIRELSLLAEEAGVKLAVENLPPSFLCCEADELTWLIQSVDSPSVGVCFDTGHANVCGNFEGWVRSLIPHTIALHIHDNDGTADQHKFPGQGTVDWRMLMRAYRDHECTAAATAECKPPETLTWGEAASFLRSYLNL